MRPIMRNRWYCWCSVCAIIIGGMAAAAGPGKDDSPAGRDSRPIKVDRCTVKLIDEVILSSERAGILGVISVQEGDQVAEGQLLATLKDDVARATLVVAEIEASSDIDIRFAQNASEVAAVEYEKVQEANRRVPGTVPGVEVRRARLAADKTVLEIEKARHTHEVQVAKRDEAAAQLATYRIEAPFEGFVTRKHLSRGAAVRQGDPVIELVSTKKVRVEGYISVNELTFVRPGSKVKVQLDAAEGSAEAAKTSFPGKIVFVDVKSTPVEHKVRVWAEVENLENKLRSGLTPSMTILPPTND